MTGRTAAFADVVAEFRRALVAHGGDAPFVAEVLAGIDAADLTREIPDPAQETGIAPPVDLAGVARSIDRPALRPLAASIERAAPHLVWRDCYWYPRDIVGESFVDAHAYSTLIGPAERGVFPAEDFAVGLFLIGPRALYRDHHHAAPELYFNLTGPTGWRFERGDWHDLDAGTCVWNDPMRIHATRTGETAWLCMFCWTKDLGASSFMVETPDWAEIEATL